MNDLIIIGGGPAGAAAAVYAARKRLKTVLIAKEQDGKYVFETHAHNSVAKTPMGAIDDDYIPNDITTVIKALEEF